MAQIKVSGFDVSYSAAGGLVTLACLTLAYFGLYYTRVYPLLTPRPGQILLPSDRQQISLWTGMLLLLGCTSLYIPEVLLIGTDVEQSLALATVYIFGTVIFCTQEVAISVLQDSLFRPVVDVRPLPTEVVRTYEKNMGATATFEYGITGR
eukprot:767463-Hanusia_phi.AAC.9